MLGSYNACIIVAAMGTVVYAFDGNGLDDHSSLGWNTGIEVGLLPWVTRGKNVRMSAQSVMGDGDGRRALDITDV
jgi:hypothetical protein